LDEGDGRSGYPEAVVDTTGMCQDRIIARKVRKRKKRRIEEVK